MLKVLVLTVIWACVNADTGSRIRQDQDDRIVFPGQPLPGAESNISKSIELAQRINSADTIEDLLKLVKDVPPAEREYFIHSRIDDYDEKTGAVLPVRAKCMPEEQTIVLKEEDDPSTFYLPSCTRVKRCGGCCEDKLLGCKPLLKEIVNYEVMVTTLDTNGLRYKTKKIIPVETHLTCSCGCRVKPEDCSEKEIYVASECRCTCNNVDEQLKCFKTKHKLWAPDLCECRCPNVEECSTGLIFDQNSCRCRPIPFSRGWFPPTKGTDYRFGQTQRPDVPPVIVPLDTSDPRRKPKDDPEYK